MPPNLAIVADSDFSLEAHSATYRVAAAFSYLTGIAFTLLAALGVQSWGAIIFVALATGGTAGWMLGGFALSFIKVSATAVHMRNSLREVDIQRAAVASIRVPGGLYVDLRDGRRMASTTFAPSLGKRLLRPSNVANFGAKAARILDVPFGASSRAGTYPCEGLVHFQLNKWAITSSLATAAAFLLLGAIARWL